MKPNPRYFIIELVIKVESILLARKEKIFLNIFKENLKVEIWQTIKLHGSIAFCLRYKLGFI